MYGFLHIKANTICKDDHAACNGDRVVTSKEKEQLLNVKKSFAVMPYKLVQSLEKNDVHWL